MSISAVSPATDTEDAWIPRDDTFGARLALVRQRMRWNIKEAASECGVPAATWRLWELEGAEPRHYVQTASAIAARTGVDLGWLMAGSRLRNRAVTSGERSPLRPVGYPRGRAHPNGPRRPERLSGSLAA